MKRKVIWLLGGYALLATGAVIYLVLRPAEVVERVVERRVEVRVEAPPSAVERAVAKAADPQTPYLERMDALAGLPKRLGDVEVERLSALVEDRSAQATVRNDALIAMTRSGKLLPGISERLAAMWRDESENREWRAYCLQHLELVYPNDPDGRQDAEKTLIAAAQDDDPYFAGTAMMSIWRLSQEKPALREDARKLAQAALKRGAAAEANPEAQGGIPVVTAMQVGLRLRDPAVLAQARRMATDRKLPVMTRLSAIGVLGEMGVPGDVPLVERLASPDEPEARIRPVAENALARLRERIERPSPPSRES